MRTKHWWLISVLGLLLVGGAAAWSLREPLQRGVDVVQQQVLDRPDLRFAVVGDNHGDNPVYREILQSIDDQSFDFLLNLADSTEFGQPEEFAAVKALESELPYPVYHTVGNHDIKTDPAGGLFQAAFQQELNTQIVVGNIRLLILDNSDRKVGFADATLDWLQARLAEAPTATWLIAYHRPFGLPLAAVVGDDETTTSRQTNQRFLDIIQPYAVRYIFTAHLHTYLPYTVEGIPAVVSGGGGDPAQTAIGGPQNNLFHYLEVEVRGQQVTVAVRRVELMD